MTKKTIILNVIVIVLAVCVLFGSITYSKIDSLESLSDSLYVNTARYVYFSNLKEETINNIESDQISGPYIKENSSNISFGLYLVPESNYKISFDFTNNTKTNIRIIDMIKNIKQNNKEIVDSNITFNTKYEDGTNVNVDDILKSMETKKIIIEVATNDLVTPGDYDFTFELTHN